MRTFLAAGRPRYWRHLLFRRMVLFWFNCIYLLDAPSFKRIQQKMLCTQPSIAVYHFTSAGGSLDLGFVHY